jgi:hypothetical protein
MDVIKHLPRGEGGRGKRVERTKARHEQNFLEGGDSVNDESKEMKMRKERAFKWEGKPHELLFSFSFQKLTGTLGHFEVTQADLPLPLLLHFLPSPHLLLLLVQLQLQLLLQLLVVEVQVPERCLKRTRSTPHCPLRRHYGMWCLT